MRERYQPGSIIYSNPVRSPEAVTLEYLRDDLRFYRDTLAMFHTADARAIVERAIARTEAEIKRREAK